jgi:hypothetical protein
MICFYFLLSSRPLSNNFKPILGQMAHNVPAVYDVLSARIRALRSKDQGWQNVGGVERGRRSRPSETEPRAALAAKHIQTCYVQCARTPYIYYYFFAQKPFQMVKKAK